jgi:hypothetical protein
MWDATLETHLRAYYGKELLDRIQLRLRLPPLATVVRVNLLRITMSEAERELRKEIDRVIGGSEGERKETTTGSISCVGAGE